MKKVAAVILFSFLFVICLHEQALRLLLLENQVDMEIEAQIAAQIPL